MGAKMAARAIDPCVAIKGADDALTAVDRASLSRRVLGRRPGFPVRS